MGSNDALARLSIQKIGTSRKDESFADHVRRRLQASPKTLSPRFIYDKMGSILFEAICLLPEYYVARAEQQILRDNSSEMGAALPAPIRLLELGSGSSEKTEVIVAEALRRQETLEYLPIDVSRTALDGAGKRMIARFPGLSIRALNGEYQSALAHLARNRPVGAKILALFLGSSLGNIEPKAAQQLLRSIRECVGDYGALLLGADLKKSEEILVAAYDDSQGITAAFNLNLLVRINRELGGRFDVRQFRHVALYDRDHGRMEMHIESRRAQVVPIESLGIQVAFEEGERIHSENSYKYSTDDFERIARESGFELARTWTDRDELFSCNLLRAA